MTRAIKLSRWVGMLALLLVAVAARAADTAEMAYSRGLVDFHAERYDKALEWFDRAVAMDPSDAPSHYYRAMTRARLNDRPGAISDLQIALNLRPDFHVARLEYSNLLIEEGRTSEAIVQLKQMQNLPEVGGRALFLLGIAYLRQDDLEQADASFGYAAERDPKLAATCAYYQGIIAQRRNHPAEAQRKFSAALTHNPGQAINREASGALQALNAGTTRPYVLYAETGLQYDSNVCLLPGDDSTGCVSLDSSDFSTTSPPKSIGNEGDGRAIFDFGGLVRPKITDKIQLTLGYEFFQSVHFNLDQFNLQDHRPRAQLTADLGLVSVGVLGEYDYYLLQTNSFLQEITALPWLIAPEGDFGRTEVFYRFRRRDFKMLLFDIRDAYNQSAGLRQLFYLGSHDDYLFLGYRFDHEDPDDMFPATPPNPADIRRLVDAQAFAYNGNEGSIGVRWLWPRSISTEVGFIYKNENYDNASRVTDNVTPPQTPHPRNDNEYRVRAYLELPFSLFAPNSDLAQCLSFGLGFLWNLNDSNQPAFQYDRYIVSSSVQFRY